MSYKFAQPVAVNDTGDVVHPGPMIREQIETAGLTVGEAARRLGVSRPWLANVLAGRNPVSASLALRLEALLADGMAELLVSWQAFHELSRARERSAAAVAEIERVG